MPFDGAEFHRQEPMLRQLQEMIYLLRAEDRWCKHKMKTENGRLCIRGALMHVGSSDRLADAILCAAQELTGNSYRGVENFNDDPATDHRLVIAVLKRAYEHISLGTLPALRARPTTVDHRVKAFRSALARLAP